MPTPNAPTEHYFTEKPKAPSAPRQVTMQVRGLTLTLWTDRGVFSHGELDRGTKLLAQTMELPPGAEVLDWGAGYGILGFVAALTCPTCRVTLVEVNERAAALAERNRAGLGLANVEVITGAAPEALGERQFDVIISNPPFAAGRTAVEGLIDDAGRRLRPGGEIWLVIPTNKGAKTFQRFMAQKFAETDTRTITGGYRILWGRKAAQEALSTV
ncbi:MAG: methyltransferase [Armatimonadia bacterium]